MGKLKREMREREEGGRERETTVWFERRGEKRRNLTPKWREGERSISGKYRELIGGVGRNGIIILINVIIFDTSSIPMDCDTRYAEAKSKYGFNKALDWNIPETKIHDQVKRRYKAQPILINKPNHLLFISSDLRWNHWNLGEWYLKEIRFFFFSINVLTGVPGMDGEKYV